MKQLLTICFVVLLLHTGLTSSCKDGQFNDNGVCKPCSAPCKTCSSATVCLSCLTALDHLLGDTCCPFFGIGPALMPCQQGYYHYKSKTNPCAWFQMGCTKCPAGCSSCDYESCYSCEDNYELSQGLCIQKVTQIGIGIGPVKFCEAGFYPSSQPWNYSCLACPEGCATCSSVDVCNTCLHGFEKEGRYMCVMLDNSTSQLTQFDVAKCVDGQFKDVDGSCQQCQQGCKTCHDAPYLCDLCQDGFEREGRWCVALQVKQGNDNENGQVQCVDGQFKDTDGSCQKCSSGCKTCHDAAYLCDLCEDGFEREGRWCVELSVNPGNGSQNNEVQFQQQTCVKGQFLGSDGTCQACAQGCADCTSTNICGTCLEGYEKEGRWWCVKTNKQELTLFQQIGSIIGLGPVKFCPKGQYPSSKPWDYSCFDCPKGCLTCSSATSCDLCSVGFKKGLNFCVEQD